MMNGAVRCVIKFSSDRYPLSRITV